ncbi:MAG: glucokinase [Paracoccaceae bacterium]
MTQALVADVGGTNTRIGFAGRDGVLMESVRRYRNDDFPDFATLADGYLAGRDAAAFTVAIAGPVGAQSGRLTNRDWHFDAPDLGARFGIPNVTLLNDLAALGHALPALPNSALLHVAEGQPDGPQGLVIGLGTGFNVSPVHLTREVVFEAETGHASLPSDVAVILRQEIDPAPFPTVEDLFSGRGLKRLHVALGHADAPTEEIAKNEKTMALMARALGALTRSLAYLYMPLGGMFFNGSLARALLNGSHTRTVLAPLQADPIFDGCLARIPIRLLVDDAAALHGCARQAARLL